MKRPLCAIAFALTLAGYAPQSGAQQAIAPPSSPSSRAVLEEAEQLNQQVVELYGEGRFQEATAPAERALALREEALGPTHPDVAQSLNNLALLYQGQGVYGKAEPLLARALAINEQALGPVHPYVAQSLNNLAVLYGAQGAYGKCEPLLARALRINEQALGPTHPQVAQNLDNLAELYQDQGAYAKGEPLLVRALAIREQALGPTHPDVAKSLNNLGMLYKDQGTYRKAEPLLLRALRINEQALGPTHTRVAGNLNNLAVLYNEQGAYGKAEPLLLRALRINEKVLGPTHPDVAQSARNLAALYQARGAYAKAEPLLVRALALGEQALGPTHPDVAKSLNNLAALYQAQGAYGKAEPLLIRALAINESALGPTHADVATSLNNLAMLYNAQGAYGKAEPLLIRALRIKEQVLGPMHPNTASSLNNLAALYQTQGTFDKAEPLYVRSLAIRAQVLGPDHPDVARSLNNLGMLYKARGAYGKAEPLLLRALAINEGALPPTHPDVATSVNNLAELYKDLGSYSNAESLYVRALAIKDQALGPMHPDVAVMVNNIAIFYSAHGLYVQAEPLVARAVEIREQQLRSELAQLSEPRKRALMTLLQGETDMLVSLHIDAMPASTQARELAFTTVLRRKGRILDSLVDNETALRAHVTPTLRTQIDDLRAARTELSERIYAPLGPSGVVDHNAIGAARARIDELESALSTASAAVRVQSDLVTIAKLQTVLPAGAALVEFVRYRRFDAREAQPWQEDRYVAYVLPAHGPSRWVALGAVAPIDAQVDDVLSAMSAKVKTSTEATQAALRRLDALVFAPIRAQLAGVSHVILAPDGKLNLVPFEALVDSEGHYALDRYLVSYVTSGRDLLRFTVPHTARSPAVIIAGPDYGPVPTAHKPTAVSFAPLAGTLAEATDLQRYFPTPLTGDKATKAALAALVAPAMLHIATHGFYARDPAATPIVSMPSTLASSTDSPPPIPASAESLAPRQLARGMFVDGGASLLQPPPRSDDPVEGLDRAGLAMAGANQGAGGIVTARELAGFDWWGTQLVVLSGCETGVGPVPSGDGVYGMRRALVLAGAASQVVSLWNVNDSSARELMRDYYGELARGTGRADALRRAKLRLMHQPRYAHPYYWAAFIPAGDWRPLDSTIFSSQKPLR